jgi:gluconolactonase
MHINRRKFLGRMILFGFGGILASCQADENRSSTRVPQAPSPTSGGPEYIVLAEGLQFPEGPAFDPTGAVWCTEIQGGCLTRVRDGKLERIPTGGSPNSLAFDHQGRLWICDSGQNSIRRLELATGKWETILEGLHGEPLQTPNDLCFDARGNLLFTCPNFSNTEPTGYVVCLRPDRTALKVAEGLYRPNGLEIVDDGKALIVGDTFQKTLFKGGWDDVKLEWKDPQTWAKVGGSEGPDGMTFGADGFLYQAIYGDGVVRVVDGEGEIRREVRVPGDNVTNVAIDPTGELGLVVTETEKGQLLSYPAIRPGAAIFDGGASWK